MRDLITVSVRYDEDAECWVTRCDEFNLFSVGDSSTQARHNLMDAFGVMLAATQRRCADLERQNALQRVGLVQLRGELDKLHDHNRMFRKERDQLAAENKRWVVEHSRSLDEVGQLVEEQERLMAENERLQARAGELEKCIDEVCPICSEDVHEQGGRLSVYHFDCEQQSGKEHSERIAD